MKVLIFSNFFSSILLRIIRHYKEIEDINNWFDDIENEVFKIAEELGGLKLLLIINFYSALLLKLTIFPRYKDAKKWVEEIEERIKIQAKNINHKSDHLLTAVYLNLIPKIIETYHSPEEKLDWYQVIIKKLVELPNNKILLSQGYHELVLKLPEAYKRSNSFMKLIERLNYGYEGNNCSFRFTVNYNL